MVDTAWNAVRFDPAERRDHLESYFLKANDPTGDRAIWIKATIFAPANDRPVAEGWAIAFDRRGGVARHAAVKQTLPYAEASFSSRDLAVAWSTPAGSFSLSPGAARGRVCGSPAVRSPDGREHHIAWDLRWTGDLAPIVPLPRAAYAPAVPTWKVVTPVPDARFDGEVQVDGDAWRVEGWRGMQGHNWGKRHTDLYAWCHANAWDQDPELVLEGFSAQAKIGPLTTPLTTVVCVRHRGVAYDFTGPMSMLRARGDVTLRAWTFSAENKLARIEGVVEADASDMVGLYYASPRGPMTYCLNSKLASARIRFEAHGRPPLSLTTRAAALEIGTHDAGHGVRMVA